MIGPRESSRLAAVIGGVRDVGSLHRLVCQAAAPRSHFVEGGRSGVDADQETQGQLGLRERCVSGRARTNAVRARRSLLSWTMGGC